MKQKSNFLKFVFAALATCALSIPVFATVPKTVNEAGADTAIYRENKLASLSRPDLVNEAEDEEETIDVDKVILHYFNEDAKTDTRAFYIWATGIGGIEYSDELNNNPSIVTYSADKTSMAITLDFKNDERFKEFQGLSSIMFIIKFKAISATNENWNGQSSDTELDFRVFAPKDKVVEVWAVAAGGANITIVDSEAKTKVPGVKVAKFTSWKTIECSSTKETKKVNWKLYAYDETYYKRDVAFRGGYNEFYLIKEGSSDTPTFTITLKYEIHVNMNYVLVTHDPNTDSDPDMKTLSKTTTVTFEKLYDTAKFKQYYQYNQNDLGFTYTPTETTFKVWAPTAANMTVLLYDSDTSSAYGGKNKSTGYHMNFAQGGIWTVTIQGNLKGKYYNYQVDNSLGSNVTMDPYATTAGRCGVRGMVYDKSETNPEGWDDLPLKWDGNSTFKWNSSDSKEKAGLDITTPQQLTIYEVHIADFTYDESWVSNQNNKPATFNAFVESGTTLASDSSVKTGYDHLDELGIDAVQLLPVFDSDNDERSYKLSFNWGYNPLNYNVVEGAYCSNSSNGTTRVKEFKNLVLQMSKTKAHTRVIMDVVYNHVSSLAASCFNKLMPLYYFRYTEDGDPYNGSGCGNEVKSEAPMMRKYIVDSLCMWAKEYKIKGFRFDLMGLIDVTTMKTAAEALYKIDPDIYLYGEGWTGDSSGYDWNTGTIYPVHGASGEENYGAVTKAVYSVLYDSNEKCFIGGFNDGGRDAIRGNNDPGYGFMQQVDDASEGKRNSIAKMIWGANNDMGANPKQTINYVSCHDNFTVRDQLYYTLGDAGKNTRPNPKSVLNGTITAHSLVFASNSAAFMLGGEELLRTKELSSADLEEVNPSTYINMYGHKVSHNSYNAPFGVNSFKWGNKKSVNIDGTNLDTSKLTKTFADMIKLHHDMPKYDYDQCLAYQKTTSKGVSVDNLSWSGKTASSATYHGCAGFQFDEYFIYASGRVFGYVSAGGVSKWTQIFSAGQATAYDSTNQTVNLGTVDPNIGCSIVIFAANGKR